MISIISPKIFWLIIKPLFLGFGILSIIIGANVIYARDSARVYQKNSMELNPELMADFKPGDAKVIINKAVTTTDNSGSGLKKNQNPSQSLRKFLANLVRKRGDASVKFYLVAFLIALILGALHALTPGHGKTIVAAYLVGSKGTTKHAIMLGSIVTLTHTGSVILLTILTLIASHYSRFFLSLFAASLLEIFSGTIILILGIYLLIVRLRRLYFDEHDHYHDHDDEPKHHGHSQHHHQLDLNGNEHHHHQHHLPDSDVNFKSLLSLGLSGGIVPCPDAIAILLLAISIKRIFLGLAIMLSFSLGLAIVLTFIGLAMVHSRKLFARFDKFDKFAPVISIVSAVIVLILGCVLTYNAIAKL